MKNKILIGCLGIAAVVILFPSCVAIKQARDNNAYDRVIGDSALSARAYNTLETSHPCIIDDSAISFIKGVDEVKSDSTITTDTVTIHDTVRITTTVYKNSSTTTVDTLKQAVQDKRQIDELTAQGNNKDGQISILNNQLTTANNKIATLTTQLANASDWLRDIWFWLFVAVCIISAIIIFLLIYFKI